jgi:hypothetical protein
MKLQILAGAAVLALIAGGSASAATKSSGAFAPPSQPVAYLKASPHKKATGDWGLDSASASAAPIGAAANTSATAPQPSAMPDQSQPQAGMMPQSGAAPADSAGSAASPMPAPPAQSTQPAQPAPDQNAPATGTMAPAGGMSQTPDSTPSTQPPGK